MKWRLASLCAGLCTLAVAAACGKNAESPTTPSAASAATASANANADGSTIKASAPTLVGPANGQRVEGSFADGVTLQIGNSVSKFNSGLPVVYHFEVFNAAGAKIDDSGEVVPGASQTAYKIKAELEGDATYRWRARATGEQGQFLGEWSAMWTFIAPQSRGYNRPGELYDPLINRATVGTIIGPYQWHDGLGIELLTLDSYIQYDLPQTITEGEFSFLVANLRTGHEGGKTKLMSMQQGYDDITTNDRRMTFEKRADGSLAWRLITHHDQIDTIGPERIQMDFRPTRHDHHWFIEMSWRNNVFRPLIREHSANGPVKYEFPKHWVGTAYNPNPHVAYVGGPGGRAGNESGSVPNMIVRQVWLSSKSRPGSIAN